MKNTVHFGFIAIILVMTVLDFVWIAQIERANEKVFALIKQNDNKIAYAHTMHHTIRNRQSLLLSMLVIDDPFELDEKLQNFYNIAFYYRKAREALHALPMSDEEKEIHQLIDKQASVAQPINELAGEMLFAGSTNQDIIMVIIEANQYQTILLKTLQHFVDFQEQQDDDAVKLSRKQFDASIFWLLFFGLIALVFAIFISSYVSRSVAEKNMELQQAKDDMESAFKKAEEATIIKSEFLATMSHEIRTPLTAIIGFAETTLFSEQTMEQRHNAIQTIIRSGKHLLQIINDILDLSKVEANKLEIEQVELSPFELLADVEKLVRPEAEEKMLGFSINYIFPLPAKIKNDPLRLKQILLNLCNNAIKFTDKGYVTINVSCDCHDNNILFEVADSGIGISTEQQDLIFQAYRQADSSTTRKFGGTGLGLSLSKLLVERMGGSLTVESKIGMGSKFKFSLISGKLGKVNIIFDKEHLPEIQHSEVNVMPVGSMSGNVLVAEDNLDNQKLLKIHLNRMGVNVTMVDNGQLAIDATTEKDFDLILMDIRMPVMGGLEAIKLLRQQDFNKPIVALTANAMQEDRDACYKAGCDGFLTKPIDLADLSEVLEKHLEVKEKRNNREVSPILSLLNDDPEIIEVIKQFVKKLPDSLTKIEKFIQIQDWKNLSDLLHQLKGTGGNCGYPQLSLVAGKMEFQTVNKNEDELKKLFFELRSTYEKIVLGLQ